MINHEIRTQTKNPETTIEWWLEKRPQGGMDLMVRVNNEIENSVISFSPLGEVCRWALSWEVVTAFQKAGIDISQDRLVIY